MSSDSTNSRCKTGLIAFAGEHYSDSVENDSFRALLVSGGELNSADAVINTSWKTNEKRAASEVIYENICQGCHYGMLDAVGRCCRICQFMFNDQLVTRPRFEYGKILETYDPNDTLDTGCTVYETCSKLTCSQIPKHSAALVYNSGPAKNANSPSAPADGKFKLRRKFVSDVFETLRKPRSLIHNNETRSAFRTSKKHSIDAIQSHETDYLRWVRRVQRRTDEQLLNAVNTESRYLGGSHQNCKDKFHVYTDVSGASVKRNTRKEVVGADPASSAKCDNVTIIPFPPQVPPRSVSSPFMVQDNISDWLLSLRRQTHEYNSYCESDNSVFVIKSIPSPNFNCCGLLCTVPKHKRGIDSGFVSDFSSNNSSEESALPSVRLDVDAYLEDDESPSHHLLETFSNNLREKLMIERFKYHLMEKQIRSKRRAIYVKIEDSDVCADDNVVSSTALGSGVDSQPKRNAIHERNSEFVNDILSAFNSLLSSKQDASGEFVHGPIDESLDCSASKKSLEWSTSQTYTEHDLNDLTTRLKSLTSTARELEDCNTPCARKGLSCYSRSDCQNKVLRVVFKHRHKSKPSKLHSLLTTIEVSKSLNGFLLTIDTSSRHILSFLLQKTNIFREDQVKLIETFVVGSLVPCSVANQSRNLTMNGNEDGHKHKDEEDITASKSSDDDIYQQIWTFRSVGNARNSHTGELSAAEDSDYSATAVRSDSLSLSIKDLSDWETDDEFTFSYSCGHDKLLPLPEHQDKINYAGSKSSESTTSSSRLIKKIRELKASVMKPSDSYQSLSSCSSSNSIDSINSTSTKNSIEKPYAKLFDCMPDYKYERVCILYSTEDSHLRAMIHNGGGGRQGHFTDQYLDNKVTCDLHNSRTPSTFLKEVGDHKKTVINNERIEKNKINASLIQIDSVPRSVQAWKLTLLSAYYMDDEEDMYVSRNEILNAYREAQVPPTSLKKCASEGNLLELPIGKKKTLGERFLNKVQAVSIFPISPRQMRDKKKSDNLKRRGSIGPCFPNSKNKVLLFGASLEEMTLTKTTNVPEFVVDCIKFIEQPAYICTDGLYRASGNKLEIDVLKKSLTERYDAKILENQDIHTTTGLLKLFFRELKSALISDEIYMQLPFNLVEEESLMRIKDVLHAMSSVSLETLKYLIKHLTRVAAESHQNRMPASNLAIIWGPCILHSSFTNPMSIARINTLTKILIDQYDFIFKDIDERLIM